MNARCHLLVPLILLLALLPLGANPEPSPQDLEHNRKQLDAWREQPEKYPEKYARLVHNAHAFLALSLDRREQILKLDKELQEQSSAARAQLLNVLSRYADWLERLEPAERAKIQEAPDKQTRLKLIHEMR